MCSSHPGTCPSFPRPNPPGRGVAILIFFGVSCGPVLPLGVVTLCSCPPFVIVFLSFSLWLLPLRLHGFCLRFSFLRLHGLCQLFLQYFSFLRGVAVCSSSSFASDLRFFSLTCGFSSLSRLHLQQDFWRCSYGFALPAPVCNGVQWTLALFGVFVLCGAWRSLDCDDYLANSL